ncbi:hypothetical protein C3747_148g445c [Trypanosoma cruzi]|uniref:Uncharacterized protein n=2 Tax=Trypanosoma cruzi TaxID=5693 RepID=Q4DLW2_TRYCC|nr:hypothetical protein, conserved [Trypanosoma cruzi]EAN93498.1 hypothetical protein, conserved [Trypanosoma cruzi]PWV04567.1 hypothetical protein C3747_148g445c [Trypanosoma cruzi]RNC37217.1 hypothetical protein TcCL_NonESM13623 [Trypanosoma cruzi]|eukprot:XP_815349.1 hypothetical protein [Trypanosoma cruzi strain CL Brener]
MSRGNATSSALQQQAKTERIVRLEVQRRHAKGTLRVIDAMIRDVDDQLLYVAQFKKEWLQHRKELEAARQELLAEELTRRQQFEKHCLHTLHQLACGKNTTLRAKILQQNGGVTDS